MSTAVQNAVSDYAGYLIKYTPTPYAKKLLDTYCKNNNIVPRKDKLDLVVSQIQVTSDLREKIAGLEDFIDCNLIFDSEQDCYFAVHYAPGMTPNKALREAYPA